MKHSILFAFACLQLSCFAQSFFGSYNPPTGPTYVLQDGFEETSTGGAAGSSTDGFDSPLVNTWFSSKPNPDWTPAMEGSQELQYTNGQDVRYVLAALQGEVWVWFMYSNSTVSANTEICELEDASGVTQGAINVSGATLEVINGSTAAFTSASLTANTAYWILWHHKNNGSSSVEFQTTSTMTGSGTHFASVTGGTGTSIQRFDTIATGTAMTNYMDHLRIAITNPGLTLP